MDWTGGTRRRFVGAKNNNTALQKQKAHFAKARAAIQHEPVSDRLHRSHPASRNTPRLAGMQHSRHGTSLRPDSSVRVPRSRASQRGSTVAHNDDTQAHSSRAHNTHSPGDRHAQYGPLAASTRKRDDEELRLLASRRKLLARSDWLALEPTRPLRLDFPAALANDRVGRRKKIKKTSTQNPKPAQQRLLTPLFEERLDANDFLMSGALPPPHEEKIEVRIGSGVFGSQSHPSRRSMVSDKGPQSSLSHLSEESMLLGADGDFFDADQVQIPVQEYDYMSQDELSNSAPFEHRDRSPLCGESDLQTTGLNSFTLGEHARYEPLEEWKENELLRSTATFPPQSGYPPDNVDVDYSKTKSLITPHEDDQRPANDQSLSQYSQSPDRLSTANPSENVIAHELDAEDAWKRLMGIATQFQSSISNKALDSSSQHLTTSEVTARANIANYQAEGDDDVILTTPQGGWSTNELEESKTDFELDEEHHSPAGQILPTNLAQPPNHSSHDMHDSLEGEALWREFIIGSQDSESEDELHSAWQRNRERRRSSFDEPGSLQLSGLGTSDNATHGDTALRSTAASFTAPDSSGDESHAESEEYQAIRLETSKLKSPHNIHALSKDNRPAKQARRPIGKDHGTSQQSTLRRTTRKMLRA